MNIMESVTLDFVSPIKTDDTTYGIAVVDAIVEKLTDYGFTDEVSGTQHTLWWNGNPMFVLQGKANTSSSISFRMAHPHGENGSNWGTTLTYGKVTTITGDSSNVRLSLKIWYFASENVAYFGVSDPTSGAPAHGMVSMPCKTTDGAETMVGIRDIVNAGGIKPTFVPFAEESMNNDYPFFWNMSYFDFGTETSDSCYIREGCALYQSNKVKYIVDDFAEIKALNPFTLGQVITVNGERYVNVNGYNHFIKLTPAA